MGYSTSIKTLEKIRPLLRPLAEGKATRWEAPNSAKLLAYKIREALTIALANESLYPELATAARTFVISQVSPDVVQATPRTGFKTEAVMLVEARTSNELGTGATAVHGLVNAGKAHELAEARTAAQVVGFWAEAQPSNSTFTFPNSHLTLEEMTKLYSWAQAQGWMIFYNDRRVTLRRPTLNDHLDGLDWNPTDGLD